MAIGFVLIYVLLERTPAPARRVSITEPLRALRHSGLRSMAVVAVLYNFGFFTILAYTPFPLGLGIHELGLVFFGWGLLVALASVFGAQRLERRFGLVTVLAGTLLLVAADLLLGGLLIHNRTALIALVVVSGALLGIVNTVLTEAVMGSAPVDRPIASASYSFVRFTGGAIAPWLAGKLAEHVSVGAPMFLAGGLVTMAFVALLASRHHLAVQHAPLQAKGPTPEALAA
jgi:predicted MFS family arabinose efflux permease